MNVKKRFFALRERSKDVPVSLYVYICLCALLFLAMLFLAGFYFNLRVNGTASALPSVPAKDRWILTGSAYDEKTGMQSILSPCFMGIKYADGTQMAATYDASARQTVWQLIDTSLEALLTGEIKRVELASNEERTAYAASLCAAERYAFYSFFGELPAASLLPALQNGNTARTSENFYVKYVFLLPNEENFLYAVMLDASLNAVCLYPRENEPYNAESLSYLKSMKGYADFTFTDGLPHSAVFTESFDVGSVVVMPSASFYDYRLGDEKTDVLLKTLGFNVNVTKCVSIGNGSAVNFVEDKRELYVDVRENTLDFSTEDGIHLSDFLGYYPENGRNYTFADRVLGVKYLLGSFNRLLVGGDALPSLVGVSGDASGKTVFYLKYFYNGVLLTDAAYDIAVEMENNSVVGVSAKNLFCDSGYMTKPVVPQALTLSLFDGADEGDCAYYAMFANDPTTNQVRLVWTAVREGGGETP